MVHHRPGPYILVRSYSPLLLVVCPSSLISARKSFVPETKGKELEDLDETFNIATQDFAAYHRDRAFYAVRRYVFRQEKLTSPSPPTPRPIELAVMASSSDYGPDTTVEYPVNRINER